MRNLLRLFGLGSADDRRPVRGRAYPPMTPATRRYELPRQRYEGQRYEAQRYESPRYDPSRRERPRRTIPWRRIATLTLAAMGAAGLSTGAVWLVNGDTFRVRVIDVQGAQVADPRAIAEASGLSGVSLFTAHLDRSSQAITKLPAVKSAQVTRDWPHGLQIAVTEHQAWGYWQAGPQRLVLDADGRVLEQSRPPVGDAPTIVEITSAAPDASVRIDTDTVQLVRRLRADGTFDRLKVTPTSYVFHRDRGLTVIVANGPAALLGDSSNYEFKVRAWQALLDQVGAVQVPQVQAPAPLGSPSQAAGQPAAVPRPGPSAAASEIDLRFGRNVVLR